MFVHVIVVRHGERLDEADRIGWHKIRTRETVHDPPLTPVGWDQSKLAAREVAKFLPHDGGSLFMYSSPTARTLSTAAGLVSGLSAWCSSITPYYALNCCAAAQAHGVAKAFPKQEPSAETMGGIALTCWPPQGNPEQVDGRQGRGGGFVESVTEIAATHSAGDVLVMVTHREGIWQLNRHVGTRPKAGYCNLSCYRYDLTSKKFGSWDPASNPLSTNGTRQQRGVSQTAPANTTQVDDRCSANENAQPQLDNPQEAAPAVATVDEVLARGSGTVMIHRGGGGLGTLLWRTPGVRGVWASGGAVPDGELVTLLSSPQSGEGNEGEFVLVQRPSGIEGWTKIKNVRLPGIPK
jgi:hypothetical protein